MFVSDFNTSEAEAFGHHRRRARNQCTQSYDGGYNVYPAYSSPYAGLAPTRYSSFDGNYYGNGGYYDSNYYGNGGYSNGGYYGGGYYGNGGNYGGGYYGGSNQWNGVQGNIYSNGGPINNGVLGLPRL